MLARTGVAFVDGEHSYLEFDRSTIEIDRNTVTTEHHAREVLQHEACHVWIRDDGVRVEKHGPEYRECMKRFD